MKILLAPKLHNIISHLIAIPIRWQSLPFDWRRAFSHFWIGHKDESLATLGHGTDGNHSQLGISHKGESLATLGNGTHSNYSHLGIGHKGEALATLGYVSAPADIVEPIIAASIAVIALENIFRPTYGKFRIILVFVFGLIHGLGFAQRLIDERIPSGSIVSSLLGFNLGVEFGQLAVIGLAIAATFWIKDEEKYRGWVVIPASTLIALAGLFWAYQRVS